MVVGEISTGVEVLVIGAGPAGYLAAIRAAQRGKDVMLVDENDSLGGVCLNEGCIPSKALIHAANLFEESGNSEELGITAEPELDMAAVQDWKGSVVEKLTSGVELLENKYGVTVVKGDAYLQSDSHARISGSGDAEAVDFEYCIIATGSEMIDIPGIERDGEVVIGSSGGLDLSEVPDRMVVIGGGYIGMELGMVYQKLGAEVTVLEAGERILSVYPEDLVRPVVQNAEDLGMTLLTDAKAGEVAVEDGTASVNVETPDGEDTLEAETVLVAVGRRPQSDDLGLDNAGVEVGGDGFIQTDDQCRTTTDNIFAIGDVAGQPMLAHKGYQDGAVAAETIAGNAGYATDFVVPAVVYTDPQIATVGMSEAEAGESGFDVRTGKFPFAASGRAATMGRSDGFIRVIAEAESGTLLGAEMVGAGVADLIGEATLAIEMGAMLEDIALTVHAHPTLSEAFKEACEDALGQAIHKYNPPKD